MRKLNQGVTMGSLFDPAGPALLAQEAWLMSVSLANWQMRTKPKELGRPEPPHAWQDTDLAAAAIPNLQPPVRVEVPILASR